LEGILAHKPSFVKLRVFGAFQFFEKGSKRDCKDYKLEIVLSKL